MNLVIRTTAFYWNKIARLIPEFAEYFEQGKIDLVSASKIAGFSTEMQRALWGARDVLTNEVLHKLHSRSRNPINEVYNIIDAMSKPAAPIAHCHIETEYNSVRIETDRAPEVGQSPVLMYLPDNILKKIQKKYARYIVAVEK